MSEVLKIRRLSPTGTPYCRLLAWDGGRLDRCFLSSVQLPTRLIPATNRLTLAASARFSVLAACEFKLYCIARPTFSCQGRPPAGTPVSKDDAACLQIQTHCRLRMAHV